MSAPFLMARRHRGRNGRATGCAICTKWSYSGNASCKGGPCWVYAGAQLINVALGGSLYQDIVTENPHAIPHVDAELYDQHRHSVQIEENSRLAKLYPGALQASCQQHPSSGDQAAGAGLGG